MTDDGTDAGAADGFGAADERRHRGTLEEWVFAAWTSDGALGVISGHRIVGATAWYWAALARVGRPLLHVVDFSVPVRADPFVVKGEQMWAEHTCDAAMEQWTVGNETYASALDDPDDALGQVYGVPTPVAFDLEWYATAPPTSTPGPETGYEQVGVVHGAIELLGEPGVELVEVPARRWHRWTRRDGLAPIALAEVTAHTGVRAPFAFPDGSVLDAVLADSGWARRRG
ncbi:hypothetical protein [Ilumatobacter sp.]|uniref:hypothetical protein n=1 Tax=Ilumatobacter sp. TaxID=1967498 RepID=UPI003B52E369